MKIQNIFCDWYNVYLTWSSIAEPYSVMQNSILEPLSQNMHYETETH